VPTTRAATDAKGGAEVSFRPARAADYGFALGLYLESTKGLLIALGRWDEAQVVSRFARAFKVEPGQILRCGDAEIGWMQVTESATSLHLKQIHLVARFRRRGFGTRLIRALLERALSLHKPVTLNVIRGNPAKSLYHRFGFRVVGQNEQKFQMRWTPERAPSR
jgi:ribosomal protein S18 acetylase RimI-like enzyme